MTVPIIKGDKITEIVTLLISVEAVDTSALENLNAYKPRLQDAYNSALYGRLDALILGPGGLVDLEQIKGKLMTASEIAFPGKIKTVLIKAVSQRRT